MEQVALSVADMATGSKEQAISLDEVNKAIDEMNEAMQQKAAMVEEITAASHALRQSSNGRTALLNEFFLDVGSVPRRASRAQAQVQSERFYRRLRRHKFFDVIYSTFENNRQPLPAKHLTSH